MRRLTLILLCCFSTVATAQTPVYQAIPSSPPVAYQPYSAPQTFLPVQDQAATAPAGLPAPNGMVYAPECCGTGHCGCPVVWLRPWKCEDLVMKPFEPSPSYCGCKGLFWCPKKEEEKKNGTGNGEKKNGDDKKNGNGKSGDAQEKKNGDDAKKDEKKNGEEEKKEEEPPTLTPLMQLAQCYSPKCYEHLQKRGDSIYGWVQQGFTANIDSPRDRVNYGDHFNWRSNDYRLNQLYFVLENSLEHEDKPNVGYRVDFLAGHDAPFLAANGLFSSFTGFNPASGFGLDGPASYREMNRLGLDLPQFYLEAHIPYVITDKGIDIRVGKFYTYMGREVYPGKDTDFYSRTWENIVATPYTHTGVMTTLHATDTVDLIGGVVVGSDVFEDNNDRPSFHGAVIWNSCDKRWNWTTAWLTGSEQPDNNTNYRTMVSSYLTRTFGCCNEWKVSVGGFYAYENNAFTDAGTGVVRDAEWYDAAINVFYTVDPRLILGARAEWFRDDDGVRTAIFGRPGFAGTFYDVTLGLTYKPYQNLRLRPEVRWDWSPDARAFNDQRDKSQVTFGIDMIWEF